MRRSDQPPRQHRLLPVLARDVLVPTGDHAPHRPVNVSARPGLVVAGLHVSHGTSRGARITGYGGDRLSF